jgi:uncharacterized protein
VMVKIPFTKSKKGVTISIRLEPRSAKKGISGVVNGVLKIKVHSPPVGGAANEELIELLSEALRVRKTSVTIIRGHSSKEKLVEIQGIDSVLDLPEPTL